MPGGIKERLARWVLESAPEQKGLSPSRPALGTGRPAGEEPFKRAEGGWGATEEPYVDLYEHNIWLREQTRWDWSALFLTLGTLGWGSAGGALAAETSVTDTGVLVTLAVGTVFFICGVILKVERSRDARSEWERFDRRLCLYEHNPEVKAIKQKLEDRAAAQAAEHTVPAKLGRLQTKITGKLPGKKPPAQIERGKPRDT